MRKLVLTILLCIFSAKVSASPARFGGFTYNRDEYGKPQLDEKTEIFNEGPSQLEEDPEIPYYLNEDEVPVTSQNRYQLIYTIEDAYKEIDSQTSKKTINYTVQGNKYKTVPIYSLKDLHEKNKQNLNQDDDEEEEEE